MASQSCDPLQLPEAGGIGSDLRDGEGLSFCRQLLSTTAGPGLRKLVKMGAADAPGSGALVNTSPSPQPRDAQAGGQGLPNTVMSLGQS